MTLLVTFDPANSTGFCILEDRVAVLSGQCDFADAMARVQHALGKRVPDAVGIEYPFIPRQKKAKPGKAARGKEGHAASAMQTAWKAGVLFGSCVTRWPRATMWQPLPSQWRSYIGIKGRDRGTIAANMIAWASATLRVELAKGEDDRAMALGLAHALDEHVREVAAERLSALLLARARGAA